MQSVTIFIYTLFHTPSTLIEIMQMGTLSSVFHHKHPAEKVHTPPFHQTLGFESPGVCFFPLKNCYKSGYTFCKQMSNLNSVNAGNWPIPISLHCYIFASGNGITFSNSFRSFHSDNLYDSSMQVTFHGIVCN